MARRYKRRRSQNGPSIEGIIALCILGFGFSGSQAQQGLMLMFGAVGLLAIAVLALVLINAKRKKERLARSGIHEIDEMSGLEFERYLQVLLQRKGYKNVKLTNTYDLGVDIIAKKNGETWAVQAKRYKGKVGLDAVRQVVAAANHYRCKRTMVITNSYFTANAMTIANSAGCVLIDRTKLIELILDDHPGKDRQAPAELTI